jgi:D-alanyl-D-alanine carboxypeptidase/D-alanyl-D-alanine-endopeptidase (penicillin-binding protein 4)
MGDSGFTGYVAIHNPGLLFVAMLREVLLRHGVSCSGRTRTVDWKYREVTPLDLSKLTLLGSVLSRPLAQMVKDTLKRSQNLYAQLLLLQVGARSFEPGPALALSGESERSPSGTSTVTRSTSQPAPEEAPGRTTEDAGIEAMNAFLKAITPPGSQLLEEGAGLAYRNEVSPESIVNLLVYMSRHRFGQAFRDSLPIAAVDGTLLGRMKGTPAAGNLRGKTGTLAHVVSLSGYVTTAAGEPLVFSMILNGSGPGAGLSGREAVDRIAVMLASFSGHS